MSCTIIMPREIIATLTVPRTPIVRAMVAFAVYAYGCEHRKEEAIRASKRIETAVAYIKGIKIHHPVLLSYGILKDRDPSLPVDILSNEKGTFTILRYGNTIVSAGRRGSEVNLRGMKSLCTYREVIEKFLPDAMIGMDTIIGEIDDIITENIRDVRGLSDPLHERIHADAFYANRMRILTEFAHALAAKGSNMPVIENLYGKGTFASDGYDPHAWIWRYSCGAIERILVMAILDHKYAPLIRRMIIEFPPEGCLPRREMFQRGTPVEFSDILS